MKKNKILLLVLLAFLLFLLYKNFILDKNSSEILVKQSLESFYDEDEGKVYTDISEKFDFKVDVWKLESPDMNKQIDAISFDVLIRNKTGKDIKGLECEIVLDDIAKKIFRTGISRYNIYEAVDLMAVAPDDVAGFGFSTALESENVLDNQDLSKDELFDRIRHVTLKLDWDNGSEIVELVLDKLE